MDFVAIKGNATRNQARFGFLEGYEEAGFRFKKCKPMAPEFPKDAFYRMSDDYPESIELVGILHVLDKTLVVSEEVKAFLENTNVEGLEFIPVRVLNHKGRPVKPRYFVANCLTLIDCIDQEKTEFEWDSLDNSRMEDVSNLTIDATRIKNNVTVFRMQHLPQFVLMRRSLVDSMASANIQGFKSTEIKDLNA